MNIWSCKIGEADERFFGDPTDPKDPPMRQAVRRAYREITGEEPDFIFSGWGAELTEAEQDAVDSWERNTDSRSD